MKNSMRRLLIISTLVMVVNNQYAQIWAVFIASGQYDNASVVDSGTIRVKYALNAIDINDPTTYDDIHRLEIGEKMSKYYSFYVYNSDSLKNDLSKKQTNVQSSENWLGPRGKKSMSWHYENQSFFYKDLLANSLKVQIRMPFKIPFYHYIEETPTQEWELHNDTLLICGYLCQKATCRFRGRDFIAWFTMGIPLSHGPWKFGGLPGLILKVHDVDKYYDFECIQIENYPDKFPIVMFSDRSFQKNDREKINKLVVEIHQDYFTISNMRLKDGTIPPFKPITYHPLELE